MSKFIVQFRDGPKDEVIEADQYTWYSGGMHAVFTDRAHCEHESPLVVAEFDGTLIRSIRIDE